MQQTIQTSKIVKQNFRDYMKRYFRSEYNFGLQYIRDIVLMLINFKEINTLKKDLGEEEYELTKKALLNHNRVYSYANLINDSIVAMSNKGESIAHKKGMDLQNMELIKIASMLPVINYRIMRAFYILVNNTDLKNTTVVTDVRPIRKQQMPSYLQENVVLD